MNPAQILILLLQTSLKTGCTAVDPGITQNPVQLLKACLFTAFLVLVMPFGATSQPAGDGNPVQHAADTSLSIGDGNPVQRATGTSLSIGDVNPVQRATSTSLSIGDGSNANPVTLTTPPQTSASSQSVPTRIAIISDLNGPYGSLDYDWHVDSTVARIVRMQPDAVILSGDMIAGQDRRLPDDRFPAMWAEFDRRVAEPLRRAGIPFGFTIGNHDGSPFDAFNREREAARAYWKPENTLLEILDTGDFPFYFSYRVNDVFIISWDASSAEISEPTLNWVREQLRSPEAREARYRIMLGHLPLYAAAVGRNRYGEMLRQPDELLEVMTSNNVDMYVSGHHHAYYPGHKRGVDLLQTGALGGGPRPWLRFGAPPQKTWSLLEIPAQADAGVTITTRDAETGDLITSNALPRHLHGLTGFTIRRDNPPAQRWSSGWMTTSSGSAAGMLPNSGVEMRLQDDSLHLDVHIPAEFAASLAGSPLQWRIHTTIAESGQSDTLHAGETIVPHVQPLIYPPRPTFSQVFPVGQFDEDGLRGGVYYLTMFAGAGEQLRATTPIRATARLMPDPNLPPGSIPLRSVNVQTSDSLHTVRWERAIDPDGDGVFYTVRITEGPGSTSIWHTRMAGPNPETTLPVLPRTRSWYLELIPNDESLHGPVTGYWISP